jgi:hypothetical protein
LTDNKPEFGELLTFHVHCLEDLHIVLQFLRSFKTFIKKRVSIFINIFKINIDNHSIRTFDCQRREWLSQTEKTWWEQHQHHKEQKVHKLSWLNHFSSSRKWPVYLLCSQFSWSEVSLSPSLSFSSWCKKVRYIGKKKKHQTRLISDDSSTRYHAWNASGNLCVKNRRKQGRKLGNEFCFC